MPTMEYMIIIGLCLWAIALELHLRRISKKAYALAVAVNKVADGKARIVRENGHATFIMTNRGE
jgi:hypothetical protein